MSAPRWPSAWLAVRSVFWTALIPGVVAGYLPWRFFGLARVHFTPVDPFHVSGLALIGLGIALLAACIWQFAVSGRGTLAPLDPPKHLVVQGLYRYVRNPMYLGVTTILFGELVLTRSRGMLAYWAIWLAAVNLFVIGFEEPTLRRQFGASYQRYTRTVGRWIPRFPSGSSSD